ncbi:hypothetical protein [Streptomyces violaceusniger]|uniref:hypothetical protein n=1 Tax=Streptomyces violaceusniger TaxID=68280 RepID=UPI0002FC870C|nr:hypothetical protein [Streptomyces violaceusniger]
MIDADDGYIPVQAEPVKVRIGGTLYTASCPPDKKWHLFTPLQDGSDGGAEAMVEFLKASLTDDDAGEILERMRDPEDDEVSLMKLMYVFGRVLNHFQPLIEEHFRAMGMEVPGDQPGGHNRETRRAAKKTASSATRRTGTKGARTPKGQTGARTGR